MFASDSRKVVKYTRMLSASSASRESEANVVLSSSTEEKCRRGDLLDFELAERENCVSIANIILFVLGLQLYT